MSQEFERLRHAAIPDNLQGQSVLDAGGFDGYFAALCLERGAREATVVDNGEWRRYGWPEPERRPGVRYEECDIFAWPEAADFVILYNILYHTDRPRDLLAHIRHLTRGRMALCTSVVEGDGWTWYADGMGHPNGTVWCRPSIPALRATLDEVGFGRVEEIGRVGDHYIAVCE